MAEWLLVQVTGGRLLVSITVETVYWCVKFGKQTFPRHIRTMYDNGLHGLNVWICLDYDFGCDG